MRLWHKDLIPVLPQKHLLAQWRECCAIASNIAKKGTPNHILVNEVLEYPVLHFTYYTNKILDEMRKRSYAVTQDSITRFRKNVEDGKIYFWNYENGLVINGDVFPDWHNDRYLIQCFYNLQEKYDRGMLSEKEWNLIARRYENFIKENKE